MPIPTEADKALAEIDGLASVVMIRLRTFYFSQGRTDPETIREALRSYADRVIEFVNQNRS